jgi:lantibiotic leader peptide-processing serine protease
MRRISLLALTLVLASFLAPTGARAGAAQGYLVVLAGTSTSSGFDAVGSDAQISAALGAAGGAVTNDLSAQIGVLIVRSSNDAFAGALAATGLVSAVGSDFTWQGVPGGGPEPVDDLGEQLQWDMEQIRADQAHAVQAGSPVVDVGVLDTGIDGRHPDFARGGSSNVDCPRGRNSIAFVPTGPGVGNPDPCVDNQFHGTHVAGTIAARANGFGVVGVAPNVTLIPVKVCDSTGHCYASAVVDGITYAGDQRLDVINMSFFVDDDETAQSTEFKCMDDPTQRAFRQAVERAIQYARNRGVTPVAALGNSDEDLAHPSEPNENDCDVVPAETSGVVGTMALGRNSGKAGYSNYGTGATDVAAPGGTANGDCTRGVPSTIPAGLYACLQGTSMASPHAAGVAALIVSEFGTLRNGDVSMSPTKVEDYLQSTTVDIGLAGYDECFGNGRIDALRAVTHDTSGVTDPTAPHCPEYLE